MTKLTRFLFSSLPKYNPNPNFFTSMAAAAPPSPSPPQDNPDELLCSSLSAFCTIADPEPSPAAPLRTSKSFDLDQHVVRAWEHWNNLGAPKLVVAPMVDNSELPFRMLCRKYGSQAAYTPMLHSRIFLETEKYRKTEFTTCKEDRPLFVQFCANDPDTLLEAAKFVEPYCDYVDINFGCPQRIAKRGYYGAFLMDNLPLIKALVEKLSTNLQVPVSCKIRIFPDLKDTVSYAKMLEESGCSLLAVHGRTRDQKDSKKVLADWTAIKEVKAALRIPVLANGNIRHMDDVHNCLKHTNADGVLSAETLLENPALFSGYVTSDWKDSVGGGVDGEVGLSQVDMVEEYLRLCERYPVPWRMVRSHVHKMLGEWFRLHPEVREEFNRQSVLTFEWMYEMVTRLRSLGGGVMLYRSRRDNGCAAAG